MKLVTGAGGFIGGHLTRYFHEQGLQVRAVDIKPLNEWYQLIPSVENKCLDLRSQLSCRIAVRDVDEVYNLAADMGGMGFIEKYRVECLRSVLINTHLIEESYQAGVKKYFYSSSACVYNALLQNYPNVTALKESDAYPAMAERGYGWEKLFSEMVCQEYSSERKMQTFIARLHNVYGPHGTWNGGREKAPAAICRKIIESAKSDWPRISIWGNGKQTRSFMFINDCIEGINRITQCDKLIGVPINLGSNELVSINKLVDIVSDIAGVNPMRVYDLTAPQGVAGRNSDNTFIKSVLHWEPSISLAEGLKPTYHWIKNEYEKA